LNWGSCRPSRDWSDRGLGRRSDRCSRRFRRCGWRGSGRSRSLSCRSLRRSSGRCSGGNGLGCRCRRGSRGCRGVGRSDRRSGRWCSGGRRNNRPLTGSFCGGIARLLFRHCGRLGGCVSLRLSLNCAANFFSNVDRDRAGVSLFLRNAEAWQKVNDGLCFDFELTG
jgi:hypothetical protein